MFRTVLLTILFAIYLGGPLMIAQWPEKVNLRAALFDAIAAARLTSKEIYLALGYDQSNWSKIERGKAPLPPFDRLENLPPAVWDHLMPRMAYVVWSRRQQQEKEIA